MPAPDQWPVTLHCFACDGVYEVETGRLTIGNVLFCPHCYQSTVVKDDLNYLVRTTVRQFHDEWDARPVGVPGTAGKRSWNSFRKGVNGSCAPSRRIQKKRLDEFSERMTKSHRELPGSRQAHREARAC